MWVPELLDCVLSLEDWREGCWARKKKEKKREKYEGRERGHWPAKGRILCAGLSCWAGPVLGRLAVPCPVAGGLGRGHGHARCGAHAPKRQACRQPQPGCRVLPPHRAETLSTLSLMPANWQSPAKWGYRFPSSDSPGNMCALSYLKNVSSSRRNSNYFFNAICLNCRSSWVYQWLDLL